MTSKTKNGSIICEEYTVDEIKSSKKHAVASGPFGSNIKVENFVASGVPVIRGMNLTGNSFNEDEFVFLTDIKADELSLSNAFPGDVIFTHRGTLGQVAIIPTDAKYPRYVISQSQMKLTCNLDMVDPYYVYYYFISPPGQYELLSYANPTGVPALYQPLTSLKKMLVSTPKIEIQKIIVEKLKPIDDKIQILEKINLVLQKIIESVFKSWFNDFDFEKNFKDSKLGRIPNEWNVVPIKYYAEFLKGFSYKGSEKFKEVREYFFVTLNSVKEGGGFQHKYSWLKSDRLKERHFLQEFDLIIANTEQTKDARLLATPAIVCFPYFYKKEKAVYSHHITKIIPKIPNVKYFLYSLFNYYQFEIANTFHTGTGVWGFDNKGFEKQYFVILPSKEILEKFENFAETLFNKIIQNEKQVKILEKMRDSLILKFFVGDVINDSI